MERKKIDSSKFSTSCNALQIRTARRSATSNSSLLICVLAVTVFLHVIPFIECKSHLNTTTTVPIQGNATVVTGGDTQVPKVNVSVSLPTTFGSSEDDYYYSDDDRVHNSTRKVYRPKHDNSKIAQIVVFFSVVAISLCGILIKYFVTQYETSQIKAQEQLHYQRLHNQVT